MRSGALSEFIHIGRIPSVAIPKAFDCSLCDGRAPETLAEVIEESKLVATKHVAVWLPLDPPPEISNGAFENGVRLRVDMAIVTGPGTF